MTFLLLHVQFHVEFLEAKECVVSSCMYVCEFDLVFWSETLWIIIHEEFTFFLWLLKRQYVVYPPEGPRPPSPEELREMAKELARKRNSNQ